MTSSKPLSVCASTDATASATYCAPLYTGRPTPILGDVRGPLRDVKWRRVRACMHQSCGNAGDRRAGRQSRRDDRAGADERARADPHPAEHDGAGPDRGAAARRRVGSSSQSLVASGALPSVVVAAGRLSLTNMTPCPTKTSSPIVTPSQMNVWLWILQRCADRRAALDLDERCRSRVPSPMRQP